MQHFYRVQMGVKYVNFFIPNIIYKMLSKQNQGVLVDLIIRQGFANEKVIVKLFKKLTS